MPEQKSFVPGAGRYTVLVDGALVTVDNWNLIPAVYQEVIAFCPTLPATTTDHTHEEHEYLDTFKHVFKRILKGATA